MKFIIEIWHHSTFQTSSLLIKSALFQIIHNPILINFCFWKTWASKPNDILMSWCFRDLRTLLSFLDNGILRSPKCWDIILLGFTCLCNPILESCSSSELWEFEKESKKKFRFPKMNWVHLFFTWEGFTVEKYRDYAKFNWCSQ